MRADTSKSQATVTRPDHHRELLLKIWPSQTDTAQNSGDGWHGGAIRVSGYVVITLINCTFADNTCNGYAGGAVDINANTEAIFEGCSFLNNWAWSRGGAVSTTYIVSRVTISFANCTFVGNTTQYRGGAVYTEKTLLLLLGGNRFSGNTAPTGRSVSADAHGSVSEVVLSGSNQLVTSDIALLGGATLVS
jgi:predicted outer membrane repeat protein